MTIKSMKWFAVGGLILFLGVAVAPSINADIEAETYPKDIQLSETEIAEIEQIMDNLRKDVEAVEPEQVIDLYLDAIDELYDYGIFNSLPKKIIIQQMKLLNKIYILCNGFFTNDFDLEQFIGRIDNINCNVVAKATIHPWKRRFILYFPKFVSPVKLNVFIKVGEYYEEIGDRWHTPAQGWITTNGANGNVSWNSTSLYGQLFHFNIGLGYGISKPPWYFMRTHYIGISHYSGLYFPVPDDTIEELVYYYMGWAVVVGIDETPP